MLLLETYSPTVSKKPCLHSNQGFFGTQTRLLWNTKKPCLQNEENSNEISLSLLSDKHDFCFLLHRRKTSFSPVQPFLELRCLLLAYYNIVIVASLNLYDKFRVEEQTYFLDAFYVSYVLTVDAEKFVRV